MLKNLINTTLREIEGVRFANDKDCYRWTINYGTVPMEEQVKLELVSIARTKKYWAMVAASRAYEKFVEPFENEDYLKEPFVLHPLHHQPRWFRGEISVAYDVKRNETFIDFNRLRGDSVGYCQIARLFIDKLNDASKDRIWNIRKNYLKLYEGIAENCEMTDIMKYLLNEVMCWELASFMC